MCPTSLPGGRKKGYMDMGLYKKIIEDARGRVNYILLILAGESLLHPKLPEMIIIAKQAGMFTSVHTNATLLTGALPKKLIESGLDDIKFSFDGEDPELYEKLRKGAKFNATLNNIKNFLMIKKELRSRTPYTTIQTLRFYGRQYSQDSLRRFKDLFTGTGLNRMETLWAHHWAGEFSEHTRFKFGKNKRRNYAPCRNIWQQLTIAWDGRAHACCIDLNGDYIIGDARKQSIMEIWNGKSMTNLRKMLVDKKYRHIKLCRNCDNLWH
jgi:radical SAM protein with 4Fe4S-binding SPASM domain